MTAEFSAEHRSTDDGQAVLVVGGEIDLSNVERFRRAVADTGDGRLRVDLTSVTYLDSAGLAVLFERARASQLEVVAGEGSLIRPLLRITRLGDVAKIIDE